MNEYKAGLKPDADMAKRLGLDLTEDGFWTRRNIWIGVVALAALLGIALYFLFGRAPPAQYVVVKAMRGDLVVTVSATGTLQPREKVDVGAEVSGRIDAVRVDFNDHVTKGQVLAVLDTEQARARLDQSQAQLASAQANVKQSGATLAQARTKAARAEELFKRNALAMQDLESARADLERAVANLQKANADARLAKAQVAADQTVLNKSVIRSPINGVVLNRQVEPGQSVAASFQTPVLFTLASDLTQMELQIDIDEADIGQVREGQHASFMVDAYPQRRFDAKLVSLHNAPKTANNVVTYQGVLLVDNNLRLLRPGLTAMAELLVAHIHDVLMVPNGALRFVPVDKIADAAPPLPQAANGQRVRRVWTLLGAKLIPHTVTLGRTDGRNTEVLSGDIKPDDDIVIDVKTAPLASAP